MTTINHQQAARVAVANTMRQIEPNLYKNPANPEIYYGHLADDAIRAAAPHLRAAWEQPIRELHRPIEIEPSDTICGECSFRLPNGTYFGKVVDWPCPTLALLEGGGE